MRTGTAVAKVAAVYGPKENAMTKVTKSEIEVNTREFYRSHQRTPKGAGCWAFRFGGYLGDPAFTPGSEPVFAPSTGTGTYGEAKRWAIAEAQRRNCNLVVVCS